MKFTNTLLNAFTKISSNEISENSIPTSKSDNFFHNSFSKLFHSKVHPFTVELDSEIEEVSEIEYLDGTMSEDEFMDMLPANSYFH